MISPRVLSLTGIVFCFCILAVKCSSILDSFAKVVHVCFYKHNTSLSDCVKERSYIALDNVYRTADEIRLIPNFVSLVLYDGARTNERSAKILLSDIENQSPENKSTLVNNLIVEKIHDFLESRAINVKIPIMAFDLFGLLENNKETEGRSERGNRGKKDKGGMVLVAAMFAGTMIALKLAAVAAIAGKALMASLMATVLAAVAALGKKGSTHGAYEVINVPPQGHQARRSNLLDTGYSNHRQLYHSPAAEHVTYNDANESRVHSDYNK